MRLLPEYKGSSGGRLKCGRGTLGWDITSRTPAGDLRFIEVKGRAIGADTMTVTRNEILYALNQPDRFILAICIVEGAQVDGPHYVRRPFQKEPDFGVTSVNYLLSELLALGLGRKGINETEISPVDELQVFRRHRNLF